MLKHPFVMHSWLSEAFDAFFFEIFVQLSEDLIIFDWMNIIFEGVTSITQDLVVPTL